MACNNKSKDSGWTSWALIVFLFAIGIWPVALFLLFTKIFGNDNKQSRSAPPPLRTGTPPYQPEGRSAAAAAPPSAAQAQRDSRAKARDAAKKVVKSPVVKKSNARTLKIVGALLAFGGAWMAFNGPIDAFFYSSDWVRLWLWELLQYLAVFVGGAGMFCAGLSMDRSMKRYAKYLSIIGDREAMSLDQLARTLGYPLRRVEKDLQKMIDKGYFGGRAYLNVELGYLFRSGQADEELKRRQQEARSAAQPPKEADQGYSGILRNIRRANDRIADGALTAKIDRLEEITAKIFRAVEEDPKKAVRIDTFMNYYLPTTQKLLNAYAEFESTGVEGENLRQAKARIEATMDSIVAGFEHQLDELYKADAMDVDSDIRVMETMLNRDTASVERDFGLGASAKAAPRAAAPKKAPAPGFREAPQAAEEADAAEAAGPAAAAQEIDLGGVAAQKEEL